MRRRVFGILSALSLLLFLATAACYLLLFFFVYESAQLSLLISGTPAPSPWAVRNMWLLPLCFLLLTLVLPVLWLNSYVKKQRRLKHRLCLACGYDLRASKERCPECGTAIPADSAASCERKAM